MSGIYIGTNPATASAVAQKLRFTSDARDWIGQGGAVSVVLARADDPKLWAPSRDPNTGVQVWVGGRTAFDAADWRRAESLPFGGGLAARLLIEPWLKSPAKFAKCANGIFAIVIHDPRSQTLHVFTDRLGVFPFYQADHAPLALCTHPDVLADALRSENRQCDFDETTLAEFIATGTATQPFTYYHQIKQLEPASHYRWDLRQKAVPGTRTIYWQPAHLTEEPSHDPDAMADALADAIRRSVQRRTHSHLGRIVVLLSGGADSRCAAFGAVNPDELTCVTLCDEPNKELAAAQRLAAAAGATHRALQRNLDYYAENASEAMRISGGIWSLVDAHFLGFRREILGEKCGSVLTGCYADYLLKGLGLNRQPRKLFRRNLPLYDFAPFQHQFYHPHFAVSGKWQQELDFRWKNRFPPEVRVDNPRARLALDDLRLRPLSREADASGRLVLQRCFPWEPFLADTDILTVWGTMASEMRLNGIVFGKAVGRVIGRAGRRIDNNNYGAPVDASETARAFWFLNAVLRRKIRRALGMESTAPRLATTGSWPNWNYYIHHSPALARLWGAPSKAERDLFAEILGRDPWQTSLADWANRSEMLILRLISARTWMRQRKLV